MKLLVVIGSSALEDAAWSVKWSDSMISSVMADFDPDHLLAGGSRGPEALAIEIATASRLKWTKYQCSGVVERSWSDVPERWCEGQGEAHFRNRVMIGKAEESQARGWEVRALFLQAAWCPTFSTYQAFCIAVDCGILCSYASLRDEAQALVYLNACKSKESAEARRGSPYSRRLRE